MSENLPATVPSLARLFEPQRERLSESLRGTDTLSEMVVLDARRALDRVGAEFSNAVSDPHLQRAGLWLIEMVKSGAGVLDQGTRADVSLIEMPGPKASKWAGRGLFYGAAAVFGVAGFVQGSGLTMMAAVALAALRAFDPTVWSRWKSRLPFFKSPPLLEDGSGKRMRVDARVSVDADGFVNALADALRTADHIMLRLSEPDVETHWRDDTRLMGALQNLFEASAAGDGAFALKLIDTEMASVLAGAGIERMGYSKKTAKYFDTLPAIGETALREAAPALIADGRVIARGTVWVPQ